MNSEQSAVTSPVNELNGLSELKPCPFCVGVPHMQSAVGEWWVLCVACGASGPSASHEAVAAAKWNRRDGISRGGAEVAEKELVSSVRWVAVGEILPEYGKSVAIWIPALKVVVRAYRDGTAQDGEDWRVSGIEGPRVAKELVTHWAPIPNGPLPPPDNGGAA